MSEQNSKIKGITFVPCYSCGKIRPHYLHDRDSGFICLQCYLAEVSEVSDD